MKIKSYPNTKIMIEDNKKFADVALLVDNPNFINDIEAIRHKLVIDKLFKGSLRELEQYPYTEKEVKQIEPLKSKALNSYENNQKTLNVINPKLDKWTNKQLILSLLYKETKPLLAKYGCPYLMLRAVVASIVCDRVVDEDYQLAKIDFIDQYRFEGVFKEIPALAIEITPFTSKSELEEEFEKRQVFYKDYLAFYGRLNAGLSKDVISTIKRDRDWYWEKNSNPKGFYLRAALKRENMTSEKYTEAEKEGLKDFDYVQASIAYVKKRVSYYKKLISSKNFFEPQFSS